MKKQEKKLNKTMTLEESAQVLRHLADDLEQGVNGEGDLVGFRKIKIALKNDPQGLKLKLTVKGPKMNRDHYIRQDATLTTALGETETVETESSEKKRYKELKKRMKETYKTISENLEAETLPAEETVNRFLEDSEKMVSYPSEYGDTYYTEYKAACIRFKAAYTLRELGALKEARDLLDRVKKQCHDQYK